ncbi:MAG: LLM class flavin-dependent oxidoreductase [Actinobacteria bacterium]|nr:LLM class flavin-dependent oxidoreductase [Actinomycetota bacterium]
MTSPLAISLPLNGVDARRGVDAARRAADLGYTAAWLAEVQGPDAFTQLGALAVTTALDLGVAVVPAQTRTPMVLGMSAVTLSQLSGGRFTLGIGASSELIVDRWAGQPFDKPLTTVRETFEALRPMLRGERTTFEGERVEVHGYRPHATPEPAVPLYLGALNQKSLRMVGELGADGLCLNQMGAQHVPQMLDLVREGAGGTLPEGFGVVARLFCMVVDDVDFGRTIVKHTFGPYIATSVYNRFYRWMGYEEEAQAILDADGDRDAQAAAISDRLVDDIFLIGPAEAVADRIRAFVEAGVTVPVVQPMAADLQQAEGMWQAIAAAYRA